MSVFTFLRNDPKGRAARSDVYNFGRNPSWRSAAGIAGTIASMPEWGVSEARANTAPVNNSSSSQNYGMLASYPMSTPPGGQTLGTGDIRNPVSNNVQVPTNTTTNQEGTINQNANDLQSMADYEFEQAMNIFGQQEGALRGQADVDISGQQQAGQRATTRATQAKGANLGALDQEGQTAETSANMGMRQARDLYRETQQQNTAQLSALGISSSSVTEALAERLGVETARRIGGITGSLEEVRTNIGREKTRVEEVFQSKLTEIQEGTDQAIAQVRAGLMQGLSQIAAGRGQAAVQKQQQRTDIAINARNLIQEIQTRAQQQAQAIQAAATRRNQALAEAEQFMFKATDFEGINKAVQGVQSIKGAGMTMQPQLNYQNVGGQQFVDVQGQFAPNQQGGSLLNRLLEEENITQ